MYCGQTGRIGDNSTDGDWFCIRGGVRQGCVLRPRLFSCVLEVAFGCWRRKVGNAGMDLQDGMHTLLDLRFADDIFFFAKTFEENKIFVRRTGDMFGRSGLHLNLGNKKILTIQSQSPSEVLFRNRQVQVIEVLHRGSTHKWLGCMLRTASTGNHAPDLADHLQAASKAFYAHTPFLVNRNVTMRNRFKYFDAMVFFFPPPPVPF